MNEDNAHFVRGDTILGAKESWGPIVVPQAAIAEEIARLAEMPLAAGSERSSLIVHPRAKAPGYGFAPGMDVTLSVLKPGEQTRSHRQNASQLEICILGEGTVQVGGQTMRFGERDVWNIPPMQRVIRKNDGTELQVRLTYSNAPMLRMMGAHFVENNFDETAAEPQAASRQRADEIRRLKERGALDIQITREGARLRGYEFLVGIDVIESRPLLWPWKDVSRHVSIDAGNDRRPIVLLYNSVTERLNGTTQSFFATVAGSPEGTPQSVAPRGHRHSSAAINYCIEGTGHSVVDGEILEWQSGDLIFSAPSWTEHAHYSGNHRKIVLTVQDHPLQIAMGSLVWQEDMAGPILALGHEAGVSGYIGPRQRVMGSE